MKKIFARHLIAPLSSFLVPLFTFSASFVVYLFTLSPTIGLEDSGELAGAVASWGIAHPSGYPLYINLAKLFTLIVPWGELAWRVNLFSAFCGSLTVGLLTFFLINLLSSLFPRQEDHVRGGVAENPPQAPLAWSTPKAWQWSRGGASRLAGGGDACFHNASPSIFLIAASTSLTFAFSPIFWSQSIIAEVYTLNTVFFVLALILLWRYAHAPASSLLYWFAFIYGLSLTNHTMLALMAPVFCIFFIAVDHAHRIPLRACLTRYARAVVLFSLGLSFYFFIFIRAHYDPVINWGHPDTLARFLVHVSRRAYQDVQLDFWNGITSLKKIIYFHFFLRDLYRQLTVVGALFSCIGFITLWFKKRTWFWLTLGMLLSNSILIIFLRSIRYTNELETIYTVYYLPSIIVAFLWFSIGVYATLLSIQRVTHRRVIILLFLLLLCILPGASFISNFHHNNRITMWLAHDWAASVLQSLEPDAILIMHNEQPASDSQIFSLAYLQLIERVRPDVAIVDFAYISSRWFHPIGTDVDEINRLPLRLMRARLLNRVWGIARDTHRPVYTLWPVGNDLNGDLTGVPNGLVYRIYPNIEYARGARITPASISLRNTDMDIFSDHPYYLDFLSEIYYARAAYLLTQSHAKASEEMLIKAYALDQTPLGASTQDLITWRERWLRKDE